MDIQEGRKSQGRIAFRSFDAKTGLLKREDRFPNTVLRSGRRFAIAALGGNLLTDKFQGFITHMAFGTGGVDGFGNLIPVPEDQSGFLGGSTNVKSVVPVQASLEPKQEAAVTFSATIPSNSDANNYKITQVGLLFSDGSYYAVSTWKGVDKDASIYNMVDWTITYL
jgi:hypothetical protein